MKDMKLEKERKFRTTLSDHLLFAIICDSQKYGREKRIVAVEDEKVEDEVDWNKIMPEAQLDEEEKEATQ